MPDPCNREICRRIAQLRHRVAGKRGKSRFANLLGIAPSTYDYYESDRVPPAPLLLRIAELAEVDLYWLLTGQEAASAHTTPAHPAVRRAAALLQRQPDAAKPLAAFLDLLEGASAFPDAAAGGAPAGLATPQAPQQADTTPAEAPSAEAKPGPQPAAPAASDEDAGGAQEAWIPLLGRSAAGVPQFWQRDDDATGVTTLADLVARHAGRVPEQVQDAHVRPVARRIAKAERTVRLVCLRAPDESGAVEFLDAAALKARHPDAFALRIDGDSMAPDIRHGDMVVLSPSVPALEGLPAVVQLRNQIGVTCKLYRSDEGCVHLAATNAAYPPHSCPADQVVWALRVLARVRPGSGTQSEN
jgi:transcriptional regulator with XRE-family HTH domain